MSGFDDQDRNLAERYSSMSDTELLNIAARSWELSDAAWEAVEDELEARDLEVPEPDTLPQIEIPEQRNLVMLRSFRDIPEAMLAKGKLDSAAVGSFLVDDNTVRMDWLWSNLLGGVKILVEAQDFAMASAILNDPMPPNLEFEAEQIYEQPRCPKCQSLDISFEELYKPIAFASLFVSFPLPVQRKGWICHTCHHAWDEEQVKDTEITNPTS